MMRTKEEIEALLEWLHNEADDEEVDSVGLARIAAQVAVIKWVLDGEYEQS